MSHRMKICLFFSLPWQSSHFAQSAWTEAVKRGAAKLHSLLVHSKACNQVKSLQLLEHCKTSDHAKSALVTFKAEMCHISFLNVSTHAIGMRSPFCSFSHHGLLLTQSVRSERHSSEGGFFWATHFSPFVPSADFDSKKPDSLAKLQRVTNLQQFVGIVSKPGALHKKT